MILSRITKNMAVLAVVLFAIVLFSASASAQTYQRGVLLEEFTGTWCGYCPRGAWYMEDVEQRMPNNAIIISWHNQDQMTYTANGGEAAVASNWGVTGYPNLLVNRFDYKGGIGDFSESDPLYTDVIQAKAQETPILNFTIENITFKPGIGTTAGTVEFDLVISPNGSIRDIPTEDTAEYRYIVVFTEDSLVYDQVNYNLGGKPNPIKNFVHNDVARQTVGNVLGIKFDMMTSQANPTFPIKIHQKVKLSKATFKPNKMRIKAAVETVSPVGTTPQAHIVRNAAQSGYMSTYPAPAPGTIVVTKPAAAEKIMGGTGSPTPITFTVSPEVVQSKTFSYSLNNGATWTTIGTLSSDVTTYNGWMAPDSASTKALVRVVDANGAIGTSGMFEIEGKPIPAEFTSFTLAFVDNNKIDANKATSFSWTVKGTLTGSKTIEMSTDNKVTWTTIATIADADVLTTTWTTPDENIPAAHFRIISGDKTERQLAAPVWIYKQQGAVKNIGGVPTAFNMTTNFPNPFSTTTTINFDVPTRSFVTLLVRNELGQEVSTLANETLEAGTYQTTLDAKNLSTGLYTYTLTSGTTTLVGKMQVVK